MKFIIFFLLTSCLPESKNKNNNENNDHEGESSIFTSSFKIPIIEDLKKQVPTSSLSNEINTLSNEYNNLIINELNKIKLAGFLLNTFNFIKNNINDNNQKKKLLQRYGINFSNTNEALLSITSLLIDNALSYTGNHKITFFSNKFNKEGNILNLFSSYKSNSILYAVPAYKNDSVDGGYEYYYCDPIEIAAKSEIVMMQFNLKNQNISSSTKDPNTLLIFKGNKKDFINCFDPKIDSPYSCLNTKGSIKTLNIKESN